MTPNQQLHEFLNNLLNVTTSIYIQENRQEYHMSSYEKFYDCLSDFDEEDDCADRNEKRTLDLFVPDAPTAQLAIAFNLMDKKYVCIANFVREEDENRENSRMVCIGFTVEESFGITEDFLYNTMCVPVIEGQDYVYRLVGVDGKGIYNGAGRLWAVQYLGIDAPSQQLIDLTKQEGYRFAFKDMSDLIDAIKYAPMEMFTIGRVRIEAIPFKSIAYQRGQCVFLEDEEKYSVICAA